MNIREKIMMVLDDLHLTNTIKDYIADEVERRAKIVRRFVKEMNPDRWDADLRSTQLLSTIIFSVLHETGLDESIEKRK
jgi:hypothetical protein